eukprot:5813556-Amphidinium_carterae.1
MAEHKLLLNMHNGPGQPAVTLLTAHVDFQRVWLWPPLAKKSCTSASLEPKAMDITPLLGELPKPREFTRLARAAWALSKPLWQACAVDGCLWQSDCNWHPCRAFCCRGSSI